MPERPHITIYPLGTRQTDYDKIEMLALKSPITFKAAQKLLIATEKFIHRKGLFTSHKKRWSMMVASYDLFLSTFAMPSDSDDEMKRIAISYLSVMSATFPNWQEVYAFLDWFIWEQD